MLSVNAGPNRRRDSRDQVSLYPIANNIDSRYRGKEDPVKGRIRFLPELWNVIRASLSLVLLTQGTVPDHPAIPTVSGIKKH